MEQNIEEIREEFEELSETQYDKTQLLKIFALSLGAEAAIKTGLLNKIPGGVVTEELVENLISQAIADYGNVKLSKFDNIAGGLPVLGVTAITVHCARRLLGIYLKERNHTVQKDY